ncbi:MAG: phosphate ABC transporter ATP-binding protein [Candidatus Omnitrophica bacterium]|nr:phosphate ABC transporter ATP-binding protein [Candidatus Omnitrophota bacterium]MBU1997142.1 phosphate ABC transporter ATP-binding protein [Candidatus Omnitrophota bacterium]
MDKITTKNLSVYFKEVQALKDITLSIKENEILGIIGPSSSGKSTFLRCINRLNDKNTGFKKEGTVNIEETDIYQNIDVEALRKKVGMVFALPVALPMTIYENVTYGPRRHGIKEKSRLDEIVEKTLRDAYLWDEVKDRLNSSGTDLSGGQQQRMALARTLAVEPDIILYDEPCSGLDPISTAKIEEAMKKFKSQYTQILVTNNTKQAARVSDRTAFFLMGELIEVDDTHKIFTRPKDERTNGYISGRFG